MAGARKGSRPAGVAGDPVAAPGAEGGVLDSGAGDALDGLVLLDLPDHDSTELSHRAQVDRLVEMVDLFVWVLDPQKYADAALHERYLRPLAGHAAVTVIVLNQIDLLSPTDVEECVRDLQRLLAEDGMPKVPVIPLSAKTGAGMSRFISVLRGRRQAQILRRAGGSRRQGRGHAGAGGVR